MGDHNHATTGRKGDQHERRPDPGDRQWEEGEAKQGEIMP